MCILDLRMFLLRIYGRGGCPNNLKEEELVSTSHPQEIGPEVHVALGWLRHKAFDS